MNAAARMTAFVLDRAGEEPIARRARLYRDLAELAVDESIALRLQVLAAELEDIEARHHQLVLDFRGRRA